MSNILTFYILFLINVQTVVNIMNFSLSQFVSIHLS